MWKENKKEFNEIRKENYKNLDEIKDEINNIKIIFLSPRSTVHKFQCDGLKK